jgi:hypothetical protein
LIPFGLAVMPPSSFIKFAHIKKEDDHYKITIENFYEGFCFRKDIKMCNFEIMAKSNKKTPKEASTIFQNIIKASVSNNPKPVKKKTVKKKA